MSSAVSSQQEEGITGRFNVALFLFCALLGLLSFLGSDRAEGVPVTGLVLTTAIDAVRYLVVVLVSALFVKEFWNRLIPTLCPIRTIAYQEAIAIVLMASLLFGT